MQCFAQTATPTAVPTPTPAPLSWAQFRYNPQNTGFYQPFDDAFFKPKWATPASLGQPNVTYSSPPVVLDLGSGSTIDGPPTPLTYPESPTNYGMLFIGTTQGKMLALKTYDGSQLWSFQTHGEIYSSPAVLREGTNSRVFFGSTDGNLYCLPASATGTPTPIWQFQTNDAIMSSPMEGQIGLFGDMVIVGSNDGNLYCLPATGTTNPPTPLWTTNLHSAILGKPSIDGNGNCYVGTQSGILYMLTAGTGGIVNQISVNGPVRSSPFVQPSNDPQRETNLIYFGAGPTFYVAESNRSNLSILFSQNIGSDVVSSCALAAPSNSSLPSNMVLIRAYFSKWEKIKERLHREKIG